MSDHDWITPEIRTRAIREFSLSEPETCPNCGLPMHRDCYPVSSDLDAMGWSCGCGVWVSDGRDVVAE